MIKKLTKIHKYAILWLYSNNISIEAICKELKLTEDQVNKTLNISNKDKTNIKEDKTNIKEDKKQITSKDMMIMQSSGGLHRVAIMTQAASENNDFNKQNISRGVKNYEHIFKPNSK